MGYTTEFTGKFWLNTPLEPAHRIYLQRFHDTRRMQRDVSKLPADPYAGAVGLPFGRQGEYFVSGTGFMGQDEDESVTNGNRPPDSQPGLWCQWEPSSDGNVIMWDKGEKFYGYVDWINYLCERFLTPWGYTLDGSVRWQGEESDDYGTLLFEEGKLSTHEQKRTVRKKKFGYGGLNKRVIKDRPVVSAHLEVFDIILALRTIYTERGQQDLFFEYCERIDDADQKTFLRVTKEYARLEE